MILREPCVPSEVARPTPVHHSTLRLLVFHRISDFDGLHSEYNEEVRVCALDIVAPDGDDLRQLPLSIRKHKLRRLPPHGSGILAAPFEQGELGPDLFKAAFQMGLEGIVSERG